MSRLVDKIKIAEKAADLIKEFFSLEGILGENLCRVNVLVVFMML